MLIPQAARSMGRDPVSLVSKKKGLWTSQGPFVLFMGIFTLTVLSLALAVAAFNNGGVILPEWNWCLIAVGGATALHFAFSKRMPGWRLDRLRWG